MTPLVSALIPNFNNAAFLPQTLQAIETASYSNIEVLVGDDASTDNSRAVITDWAAAHPKCRAFFSSLNRGVDATMNSLLREARGEFVYFRGSDDIDHQDFVAKSVAMLTANPTAALCCADIQNFYEQPGDGFTVASSFAAESRHFTPAELAEKIQQRQILGYAVVVRRSLMIELGGFDASLRWTSDLMAFLVLGFRHGICYIPEDLAYRRVDRNSFSAAGSTDPERLRKVLVEFLRVLTTNYPDVCPHFMRSGWLGYFGPILAEVLFENPSLQTPQILLLAQRNLWQWNTAAKNSSDPFSERIAWTLRKYRDRLRSERGLIVVYGAGRHSEILIRHWGESQLPSIHHFLTTDTPTRSEFADRPVFRLDDPTAETPDLIVLSSQSFEAEMNRLARKQYPSARILSFWNQSFTTGAANT